MLVYKQNIKEVSKEDLEHRLKYLKRNMKEIDSMGRVEFSFIRHQELLCIKEELLRRGA